MWSKKNKKCIKCKTTDRPHRGKGLCELCYGRNRYADPKKRKRIIERLLEQYYKTKEDPIKLARLRRYQRKKYYENKKLSK